MNLSVNDDVMEKEQLWIISTEILPLLQPEAEAKGYPAKISGILWVNL